MINFESIKRRLQMMVSTGLVQHVNDDPPTTKDGTPSLQELQITQLEGETRDKRENYQQYGFAHWPHPNAEAICLTENGDREHLILICVADRWHRLKLKDTGEVAIYDDQGQYVWLMRDGIEIKSKGPIRLKGDVEITGSAKVNGRHVRTN